MNKLLKPIALVAFLFLLLSTPEEGVKFLRRVSLSSFAPTWKLLNRQRGGGESISKQLQLENLMLRKSVDRMQKWALQNEHVEENLQELLDLEKHFHDPFFARRGKYLTKILQKQLHALPASVVLREPLSWSSTVWIGVGEKDNQLMGEEIVARGSPVVSGKAVVGVVEMVLETRSLVRLITDRALVPSVRAVRGKVQDELLGKQLYTLIEALGNRSELPGAENLASVLGNFAESLNFSQEDHYLAKGELRGGGRSLWRMGSQTLKGVGFNYQFTDAEGESKKLHDHTIPLIQKGDLLVTTGMDGLFPPDLHVAVVSKIFPLSSGSTTFSIEAQPLLTDLSSLSEVFVLPPR